MLFFRTTGNPGSKSPAGASGGPGGGGGSVVGGGVGEPRTPTAGPQNKQLQNVKGEHPSVCTNLMMTMRKPPLVFSSTLFLCLLIFI